MVDGIDYEKAKKAMGNVEGVASGLLDDARMLRDITSRLNSYNTGLAYAVNELAHLMNGDGGEE